MEVLEPGDTVPDELLMQLREMKLMALQRRALSAGIVDAAVLYMQWNVPIRSLLLLVLL